MSVDVDGWVPPVPNKNLAAYRRMARLSWSGFKEIVKL
jgi:uncharacterized protein YbaA (DUF1428 family)